MAFSSCDLNEAVCEALERAGLARFDLADDDESTGNIRAADAVQKAIDDRAELRAMLERLIEWDAFMGGHEDTRWMMARDLYARTANQLHTVAPQNEALLEAAAHGKALADQG